MTNYLFLWETTDGNRCWEAVEREQAHGFIQKLLEDSVVPSSIIVTFSPVFFHWLFPSLHNDLSDVCFGRINEEIMGSGPVQESRHKPVEVEKTEDSLYGWISPDGRYFRCEYGGHIYLAGQIVGSLQKVDDPERHLEDLGWAKVSQSSVNDRRYIILMGENKKLTDAQLNALKREGLDSVSGISNYL